MLEAPGIQKVMHGADYDVLIFRRTQGIGLENLFDTMIAARVLGWPKCGLASLLSDNSCCSRHRPQPPESPSTSASLRAPRSSRRTCEWTPCVCGPLGSRIFP